MNSRREFRRITFDRKLDVKRLQALLDRTIREVMKEPASAGAPARVESILFESNQTTVYLSGNSAGLNALAAGLRSISSTVKISKSSRAGAARPPKVSG